MGDLGSANRYVYADDDPVDLVDPSGNSIIACLYGEIAGLVTMLLGIASSIGAGYLLAGAEQTLATLVAEEASAAMIDAATLTVIGSQIIFWVSLAAAALGAIITLGAFIICASES